MVRFYLVFGVSAFPDLVPGQFMCDMLWIDHEAAVVQRYVTSTHNDKKNQVLIKPAA